MRIRGVRVCGFRVSVFWTSSLGLWFGDLCSRYVLFALGWLDSWYCAVESGSGESVCELWKLLCSERKRRRRNSSCAFQDGAVVWAICKVLEAGSGTRNRL